MQKYLAVRFKREGDALWGLRNTSIVASKVESRDPFIKNIADTLHGKGLEFYVDDCRVLWFLVEDDFSVEHYQRFNEVEFVLDTAWVEAEKSKIRGLIGMRYVDACAALVADYTPKSQSRSIKYVVNRDDSTRVA